MVTVIQLFKQCAIITLIKAKIMLIYFMNNYQSNMQLMMMLSLNIIDKRNYKIYESTSA